MKKSYYISIGFLVALSLGISFLMRPGERELGLMNMQDKKFEQALAIYEQRYQEGDHSVSVSLPLSKLYLQYGQINKAIAIMETFTKENPGMIPAWEHLATLYQQGNRPEDYLHTLEQLSKMKHSPDTLKKLANIYNFKGSYDEQITTLDALVRNHAATPQDIMMLVYLHINRKNYHEATQVINYLKLESIQALPIEITEFLCGVLIEAGKRQDALAFARNYINITTNKTINYSHIIFLASAFENKGFSEGALALLNPLQSYMEKQPELLAMFAHVQASNGNTDESFRILLKQFESNRLTPETTNSFIELVLLRKAYKYLPDIIQSVDLASLPEEHLTQIVQASLSQKKHNLAPAIIKKLGKPFLEEHKFLMIALNLHNAIHNGEEPILPLNIITSLPMNDQITLAQMCLSANLQQEALAIVNTFSASKLDPSASPIDLASLYIALSKPEAGRLLVNQMKVEKGSIDAQEIVLANIIFDTALAPEHGVLAWLETQSSFDRPYTELLTYTAIAYKKPKIALHTSQLLYNKHPSMENQIHLAQALNLNHRYDGALQYTRPLLSKHENAVYPYIDALLHLTKNDQKAKKELHAFLKQKPFMKLDSKQKHNIAFLLLEHNQKPLAESLFFSFAKQASPSSPDVQQLLYLWGPELPQYAQKWLISRTKSSTGNEQAAWFKHMGNAGMNDMVITLAEANSKQDSDAYIESLISKKQFDKVETILRPELAKNHNIKRTKTLTNYAMQANLLPLAEDGYTRLYNQNPDDYKLLKNLAEITYYQGKYRKSESYIKEYFQHDANDYLTQYYYAEIMRKKKQYGQAKQHYAKAKELIVASPQKEIRMELTHALSLYYLGNAEESFELFRNLLAKHPQHSEIRESFAGLLIEKGLYSDAEEILYGKDNT